MLANPSAQIEFSEIFPLIHYDHIGPSFNRCSRCAYDRLADNKVFPTFALTRAVHVCGISAEDKSSRIVGGKSRGNLRLPRI
jgi:hypothetical protein